MLSIIGNIFMVMFLWGLFGLIMHMLRFRRTLRKYKDDPNVKGVQIVNGQVRIIKKDENVMEGEIKEETKDMVYDEICDKEIEKSKAYHMIRDGKSHYFCSWECREKFLESLK